MNKPEAPATAVAIPVMQEEIRLGKETVRTGRVQVRIEQTEVLERLDLEALSQTVEIERKPVHREVEAVREPWREGDTLVVPVYEEEIVVTRRLILKEEVRLHTRHLTHRWREEVPLRQEEAIVRRDGGEGSVGDGTGPQDAAGEPR